jgi:hypothetical protein
MVNLDTCPFEVLGYYETLQDARTGKVLGDRPIKSPNRPFGSDGREEYDLTEPTFVKKGHRTAIIKASKDKPVRVVGMLQILCGRAK